MKRSGLGLWLAMGVFALLGAVFLGVSAYDFIAHLDRQVHAITCSWVPGVGAPDASGASGCHAVMMSPYSAVLRTRTWGGIPIALPGLAVFLFLLFRVADLWLRRAEQDAHETRFLLAAAVLPVVASVVYFIIAAFLVGSGCKLCIGTYVASVGFGVCALLAHRRASGAGPLPWGRYALLLGEGVAFVTLPTVLYLVLKPAPPSTSTCGDLPHPEDRYGVRLKLSSVPGGIPAIEVLDPLCLACKSLDQRLDASGFADRLSLEAVLFPLDRECNWMIGESVHPGACTVSEAVLCGGDQAPQVLAWVFAHHTELRELGARDPGQLAARIRKELPFVANCLGKPEVRSRLNRSLRWTVANSLPVLTPQLFVGGEKICPEDSDLGLDYVLSRKLADRTTVAQAGGR
ncbi:MAG: hypothetical protein KA072_09080 [Thermoanaerobaculaceae bacterium]|nr:hypothetical protein [Thermoanaerobaculaceae bacterium]MDI9621445.1 vitamin K epoxide reductase family protein [Acidobacteriota bacterium]NLH12004.1 hypothetical protein [Holophagae bacterium]HPW55494.1 vitamin K epoxide reductase family protein [Thermoanaerobaculaceae bacterium]